MTRIQNLLLLLGRWVAVVIRGYQLLFSPLKRVLLGPHAGCRFHPSCSQYALVSFRRFGIGRGAWLALKRVLKCHPFSAGGFDPVPNGKSKVGRGETEAISRPCLPDNG